MALHTSVASMLMESLDEILAAAKYCIESRKEGEEWGRYATGGCVGFPSAILLFSLVDTIGSYYRGNKEFFVTVEDRQSLILCDSDHFKILNSDYFGLCLNQKTLDTLYTNARCHLVHNSVLTGKIRMVPDNKCALETNRKAIEVNDESGFITIYMKEFWELCRTAVNNFKPHIMDVVPSSKRGKHLKGEFKPADYYYLMRRSLGPVTGLTPEETT